MEPAYSLAGSQYSLAARLRMFSWCARPTVQVEWDPRIQVMAECKKLKFSCAHSYLKIIMHAKSISQLVDKANGSEGDGQCMG